MLTRFLKAARTDFFVGAFLVAGLAAAGLGMTMELGKAWHAYEEGVAGNERIVRQNDRAMVSGCQAPTMPAPAQYPDS
ncbi:MAG: hypothetical protein HY698_05520 [Deltaproteobacteria bacterium]|nr:hypothetical protein [Deltaproteobacteria bacterium]